MTDEKIVDAFMQAKEEGFVKTFDNNIECNDDCNACPAAEACLYLSEGKEYDIFVFNYRRIYKLLKDKE